MEPEKILDLYHEHYRETLELSKEAQRRRNKSFVILCVLEAISFMLIYNPDLICGFLNDTIRARIESTILLSNAVLQTLVWILIAYVLIRYVQDVVYVERQYPYLNSLEKRIAGMMGSDGLFSREGEHYLRDYLIVLNLIDLFYKTFCPILFTGINIAHIVEEWRGRPGALPTLVDASIFLAIFVITWFYYFEIHPKTTRWCKRHVPGIRWAADKLHKILKEV